ncbi:hypothetical protein SM11_pC1722 (plasmid) [Sinorhizobium meliloti SM11]|uniref:Uncharacterized protein n=1 Tax=Sinorhizobium meliloti (strain SM11) TaxID=707241 RepID=F7XDA1_SINMM|nr:hypothetical protein SM11_pC1722 [Sinorhizobium meliloti SM11]
MVRRRACRITAIPGRVPEIVNVIESGEPERDADGKPRIPLQSRSRSGKTPVCLSGAPD